MLLTKEPSIDSPVSHPGRALSAAINPSTEFPFRAAAKPTAIVNTKYANSTAVSVVPNALVMVKILGRIVRAKADSGKSVFTLKIGRPGACKIAF